MKDPATTDRRWTAVFLLLSIVLAGLYAALALLSDRFRYEVPVTERPILSVLGILVGAFLVYLFAIYAAIRVPRGRLLVLTIVLGSILFRGLSLVSWPILEIDYYRYIWDGHVVNAGVSPYRYSPEQIETAVAGGKYPDEMELLVALRSDPSLDTILSRIHYDHLPTIYPPVSQAVFAAAAFCNPSGAGVYQHILMIKAPLVLFDLATLAVVFALLRLSGRHPGWSVAYGWCPLVIKEVANTGHLDSVAVFLTTLALYFLMRLLVRPDASAYWRMVMALLSGLALSLAIGAKLYPIIFALLFAAVWLKCLGWWRTGLLGLGVALLTAALLWPMMPWSTRNGSPPRDVTSEINASISAGHTGEPHILVPTTVAKEEDIPVPTFLDEPDMTAVGEFGDQHVAAAPPLSQDPSKGLTAFLSRWEKNDFLFLLVVENLRPRDGLPPEQRPWFSVVPEQWKQATLETFAGVTPGVSYDQPAQTAFLLSRLFTACVYLLIAAALVWRVRQSREPDAWLCAAFLTIAWFWLLSPTQNPWYWTWAMPLVMFARCRAWLLVSGLALTYYLRFWLDFHFVETEVLGTPYTGAPFFDFVVTWLEFGPWFV